MVKIDSGSIDFESEFQNICEEAPCFRKWTLIGRLFGSSGQTE
jgi:hypothetical protein